ncbi:MAG: flagellar hook-length control protein FliK [Desulfuromonadales bacterium]|nr:flagellar hook-length control protein FliK [Desulfuromonadales bacterium]
MHALSMIDMGAKAPESITPAKPVEKSDRQFGKVLGEQQRAENTPDSAERTAKPQSAEQQTAVRTAEAEEQPEQQTRERGVADEQSQAPVATQPPAEPKLQVEPQLQKTLVQLLKVLAEVAAPQKKGLEIGKIEAAEEIGSMEDLLAELVQQLDTTDLQGEQVLAGIDLSALVGQLQMITAEGGEERLAELVVQLEEQLAEDMGLSANVALVATARPENNQRATAPTLVENLAKARQFLQKTIDSVAAQKTAIPHEEVVAEEQAVGQELLLTEEQVVEKIDPRFAGLLKPRLENRPQQPAQSLREQVQGRNANMASGQANQAAEAIQQSVETNPQQAKGAEFAEILGASPKQAMESLVQQVQGSIQQQGPVQNQGLTSAKLMPETPMVQLPSGQQVAESQIFDQVVARMSGSFNGQSGRMVLRLQPAELGSLKLELMVEGDRVRVNLQAQSLQVQEVLERNFSQLRNALAEQGLKIDQFQVNVDRNHDQQNQFDQLTQQQHSGRQQPRWNQSRQEEEQIIPLAHLMQNGGGGISLHV